MTNINKLYIITGPAKVGKSTISNKLAESLSKSVLIEGDTIYNFFITDRIKPWQENAPLNLFWNNCIYLIKSYLENGYNVVFNYIINPSTLEFLNKELSNYNIIFKVLLTDEDTIIKRDLNRPLDCQMKERCIVLLRKFISYNYPKEYIIDTNNKDIDRIVNEIINS